jgi:hypothetical protein
MKVVAFITDYAAVDRIIDHRGASKTVKQYHQSSPATEVQQGAKQAPRRRPGRRQGPRALQSSFAKRMKAGFVWGSVSAVLSRVFTSRVSAPGFTRGSTSAAKVRPLNRRLPRFLPPFLPATVVYQQ